MRQDSDAETSRGIRAAHRPRLGLLAAAIGILAGGAANGAEGIHELPDLVATPIRGPAERAVSPASVSRIPMREGGPASLAADTPGALGRTPSVMNQKTGRAMGSPFLRGFTGFRTLALVDGVRLNHAAFRDGPNQYWNTIDPLSIDRYEIVLGPASVLYGSDAVGGAVQAFPVEPPGWTGSPDRGGRFVYRGATAESSHVGRVEAFARHSGELGWILGLTGKSAGDLHGGRSVGRQPGTGYEEIAGDARLRLQLAEEVGLTLTHQSVRQDGVSRTHRTLHGIDWKGLQRGDDLRHDFDHGRDLTILRLDVSGSPPAGPALVTLSRHAHAEDRDRIRADGRRDLQGFDVVAWGVSVQGARETGAGWFDYGVDAQWERLDSYARQYDAGGELQRIEPQGPIANDSRYDLIGLYLQHRIEPEPAGLVTGLRYSRAALRAPRVPDPEGDGFLRFDESWDALSGSIRGWIRPAPEAGPVLYAGVSQGFRAPNLSDMTRMDTARSNERETPAPDLDPEQYLAAEIGVRAESDRVRLEAAGYRAWIDGMIVRTPTGRILPDGLVEVTKRNAGDGYVQGVELRADALLSPSWTFWGQAAWMEGRVDGYPSSAAERQREPVSRLMPPTVRCGLKWSAPAGRYWVELSGEAAEKADRLSAGDRRDTQRIPPGGTPGYAIAHLRGGVSVSGWLRLAAAVENLLDSDYRIHGSGVNEPGRNFVLSAEAAF